MRIGDFVELCDQWVVSWDDVYMVKVWFEIVRI